MMTGCWQEEMALKRSEMAKKIVRKTLAFHVFSHLYFIYLYKQFQAAAKHELSPLLSYMVGIDLIEEVRTKKPSTVPCMKGAFALKNFEMQSLVAFIPSPLWIEQFFGLQTNEFSTHELFVINKERQSKDHLNCLTPKTWGKGKGGSVQGGSQP